MQRAALASIRAVQRFLSLVMAKTTIPKINSAAITPQVTGVILANLENIEKAPFSWITCNSLTAKKAALLIRQARIRGFLFENKLSRFPTVGLTTQVQRDRPIGHLSNARPQRSFELSWTLYMLKDALSSLFAHVNAFVCGQFSAQRDAVPTLLLRKKDGIYMPQTVDKKLFSPLGGE